jgi:ribonucleoside-diphosphate reductase alpha chain
MYDPETGVNWGLLTQTIHDIVRMGDDIIDYTPYHFKENEAVQKGQRRIGIGTMGLADLMIDLKIRYGSKESVGFTDMLYRFIKNEAYRASALLAKERGAFPGYKEDILKARIPQSLSADVLELIKANGLRNSHLLTQAPTGTTGTKTGRRGYSVSTGIEPFFALEWTRTSRMGTTKDYLGKAKEWLSNNPGQELPDYFVSAMGQHKDGTPQISPTQHVDVQAAIQKHCDAAISKTTNVPGSFTKEENRELYKYGFNKGLLGITIYRDGSRDTQVLNVDKPSTYNKEETAAVKENDCNCTPKFKKRPQMLSGVTIKTPTPFGKAYVTVNKDDNGCIDEMFIRLGKTGADIGVIADGLAIAITGLLSPRISGLSQEDKLTWIIKKFKGMSGANSVGFGKSKIDSLPDAIAKVLATLSDQEVKAVTEEYDTIPEHGYAQADSIDICPSCGKSTFARLDGCYTCLPDLGGCGFSKCG